MVRAIISKFIGKLKKNDSGNPNLKGKSQPFNSNGQSNNSNIDLVAFVEFVVRSLVDHPEEVNIETEKDNRGVVVKISCNKDEIRKVIGKNGKTINSIRALVKGAARRLDHSATVVVVE